MFSHKNILMTASTQQATKKDTADTTVTPSAYFDKSKLRRRPGHLGYNLNSDSEWPVDMPKEKNDSPSLKS